MIAILSAVIIIWIQHGKCRDEEKIMKACYWPNEIYEPCFGGCAEISCDNPKNHLRPCYPYCEPGCVCDPPYVRDDRTHQCVLPHDCSPTQMGIPVASRRSDKSSPSNGKYFSRPRPHPKRDDLPPVFPEPDVSHNQMGPPSNKMEDFRRQDVSRMGNYFNIVIAPPPIKSLQPRKMLNNGFGPSMKRRS